MRKLSSLLCLCLVASATTIFAQTQPATQPAPGPVAQAPAREFKELVRPGDLVAATGGMGHRPSRDVRRDD